MVSVFDGQLTRTWFFDRDQRRHVINLYHDTITGVRSGMLDYQEIRGSLGNSSLLMDSKGHRIFFTLEDLPGYIEIKREGWAGFAYSCVVNDLPLPEATEQVATQHEIIFRPKIIETTFTQDENSEHPIAWYLIRTTRTTDNVTTAVHRRFREFVELNSQVKQNLKGHHLRNALPTLPEKPLKSFTDHRDPTFIQDRASKLEIYLASLVAVPHVSDMVCTKAFLGVMEQVREFSISFHTPTIGMSLLPCDRLGDNTPAIVGLVQKPDKCEGVLPGDSLSKINGIPVAGLTFNAVVVRIKQLPRPIIIHFIQVINAANRPKVSTSQGARAEPPMHASEICGLKDIPPAEGTVRLSEADPFRLSAGVNSPEPGAYHHHINHQAKPSAATTTVAASSSSEVNKSELRFSNRLQRQNLEESIDRIHGHTPTVSAAKDPLGLPARSNIWDDPPAMQSPTKNTTPLAMKSTAVPAARPAVAAAAPAIAVSVTAGASEEEKTPPHVKPVVQSSARADYLDNAEETVGHMMEEISLGDSSTAPGHEQLPPPPAMSSYSRGNAAAAAAAIEREVVQPPPAATATAAVEDLTPAQPIGWD